MHFGVLMATIVTMGVMTPPVGSALYTVCGILECPVEEYTKEALPFFLAVTLEMIVLVFFPNVAHVPAQSDSWINDKGGRRASFRFCF